VNRKKEEATPDDAGAKRTDEDSWLDDTCPRGYKQADSIGPAVLARLLAGAHVDAAVISALQDPWRRIAEQVARADGNGRLQALREATASLPEGEAIKRAVLSCDPDRPLPGAVVTWADIARALGPIEWFWPKWLPRGFVTILAGDLGAGKSALALRIAAVFCAAWSWPDGTQCDSPGEVLWLEAESAQAINLERARNWGLPLDNIVTMPDPFAAVNLDDPAQRAEIEFISKRPSLRLIVVDSLRAATRGDENSSATIQAVLWLASLARDHQLAVLLLHHLRKRGLQDRPDVVTLDRLRGSSAIVQPARVVWAIDAPDPTRPEMRRLSVIKSNLACFPEPLGFQVTNNSLLFGPAPEAPRQETRVDRACDLLLSLLRQGPREVTELQTEAEGAGLSWDTMKRAKGKLGVVAIRDGKRRLWLWALPARE